MAIARKHIVLDSTQDVDIRLTEEEYDLEFLGVIGFVDPIKPSTFGAVKEAHELGVIVKILTGDSPAVSGAVGHEIGLIESQDEVITGDQFEALDPIQQYEAIEKYHVFARVSPEQKYTIVKMLQESHEVGFLGEGINDAPALKAAGVSIVVDSAADIARDVSDIILLKHNLKVVIDGIKEGRIVFANTTKYIKATLASSFGNFYAVAVVSLFVDFLPLLPLQILLINLLSDFPMIGIATDTVDQKEILKPKKQDVGGVLFITTVLGVVSAFFDFVFFGVFLKFPHEVLQTNWFVGSILTELVFLFSIRTRGVFWKSSMPSLWIIGLSGAAACMTILIPYTRFGHEVFGFVSPSAAHMLIILLIVAVYLVSTEVIKLMYYRFFRTE